ncbi:hypothetical protein PROFUN_11829 [Planoprotostelium fungivorum]|uniref:Uncharacterized protein n=1 Tax=Planoprotostelium fungivorum TaxID=1890364 RepID=A0A2P6N984_9EUKA|nr:hypothetical protein PROFUN_11829 [Planoprotostelium fungivorum]
MKRSREAVLGDGSPSSSLSSPPLCDTSSEERGTLMVGIPIGGRPYLLDLWNGFGGLWSLSEEQVSKNSYKWGGMTSELGRLANVIEDDVLGGILNMRQLGVTLAEIKHRGRHTLLAVSPNVARSMKYDSPHRLRGITSIDLKSSESESASIYDHIYSQMNPHTKTVTLSTPLTRFPGLIYIMAMRQVSPGIILILSVTQDTRKNVGPHKLPSVPSLLSTQTWKRNGWDEVLENCIRHVIDNRHHYASREKMKLPEKFLEDEKAVYCYVFKSENSLGFLPSGNSDGFWWKSSRGIVSAGDTKRKYHYVDLPDGRKLRRRVMWLEEKKDICIVEYRHFDNINTDADKLMGPECMDWPTLLNEIHSGTQPLTASLDRIGAYFDMAETSVDTSELTTEDGNVESYVNGILGNWASEFGRTQEKVLSSQLFSVTILAAQKRATGNLNSPDRHVERHAAPLYHKKMIHGSSWEFLIPTELMHMAVQEIGSMNQHDVGYTVGYVTAARLLKDSLPLVEDIDKLKFICKEFWMHLFQKHMDSLRANRRGSFILHDEDFRWLFRRSTQNTSEMQEVATKYLRFPSSALAYLGVEAKVTGHIGQTGSKKLTAPKVKAE